MIERANGRDVAVPARRVHAVQQGARLSIGAAGVTGGVFLLATNVVATLTTAAGSIPWVSLSANVALIFGSAMFFREYRRARAVSAASRGTDPEQR